MVFKIIESKFIGGIMKKNIILILLLAGFSVGLFAQSLKLAYVDSNRIMMECNDTKAAQTLFQKDRENWDKQIDDLTAEIRRLENEYETRRLTLSESGKREAQERIATRLRERQNLLESIYGEDGLAARRNAELLAPIMEKLRVIIDRIAIDENYSMIFDIAAGGVLWAKPNMDITQQLIVEMNKAD